MDLTERLKEVNEEGEGDEEDEEIEEEHKVVDQFSKELNNNLFLNTLNSHRLHLLLALIRKTTWLIN